jgi:hypothetical protein
MIKVDKENPLSIPEILLDKERFDIYNSQTLLRVVVKNPNEIKSVYHQLKSTKTDDYKVILPKDFQENYITEPKMISTTELGKFF